MDDLPSQRAALLAALTTALPTRTVTRDLRDFAGRADADLLAGVITLVGAGEKDYANGLGRAAQQGTLPLLLVGQLRVAEDADPRAIEDAEDTLAEEIKAFVRAPGADLGGLVMTGFRQSGQLDFPYGGIVVDLELRT